MAGMSNGRSTRATSLRPPTAFSDGRGGLGAACCEHTGVQATGSGDGEDRGGTAAVRHGVDAIYGADDVKTDDDHQHELETQLEEEAERARPLPTSEMPARSEFLDHCVTHCPYRT